MTQPIQVQHLVRVSDPDFPSCATFEGRATDYLLFPTKMLSATDAMKTVYWVSQEGRAIQSVAVAERLVLSLLASGQTNALWVSQVWEVADDSPTKIGTSFSSRSPK